MIDQSVKAFEGISAICECFRFSASFWIKTSYLECGDGDLKLCLRVRQDARFDTENFSIDVSRPIRLAKTSGKNHREHRSFSVCLDPWLPGDCWLLHERHGVSVPIKSKLLTSAMEYGAVN